MYNKESFGTVAGPYLMPSAYKRRFIDTQYDSRKDDDIFMIGDSKTMVDTDGDITIKERVFKGSKGMWELLMRKNVNKESMTKYDLKTYK